MLRTLVAWMVVLAFVAPCFPSLAHAESDSGQKMRVTASTLNLRSGPGTENAVLRSLANGTIVRLEKVEGDWSKVRLDDGQIGWVATKYLEAVADADAKEPAPPAEIDADEPGQETPSPPSSSPREGSRLGALLKWSCLAGAVVAGGLAYSEKSRGDDSYASYKELHRTGQYLAADVKFEEATDHDDKAKTYMIVSGGLLGLFALQQFVLGSKDKDPDRAALPHLPVRWDPSSGGLRAELVRLRF